MLQALVGSFPERHYLTQSTLLHGYAFAVAYLHGLLRNT